MKPDSYPLPDGQKHKRTRTVGHYTFRGVVAVAQCGDCNRRLSTDVYYCFDGRIRCGDCRYEWRHGHYPVKQSHPGAGNGNYVREDDMPYGPHTLGRIRHQECPTELAAKILQEIEP